MTVGSENSHKSDCGEVLDEVYLYLDLECDEQRRDLIRAYGSSGSSRK